MSNCHTCHWADRDPETGEQVIHMEPDFLNPSVKPGGAVPDVRVVHSCGRGAHYYRTYGQRDHDCAKFEDATEAAEAQEKLVAKKRKTWKSPTSRAKLPQTTNSLQLIEDMSEGSTEASNIFFDVMGLRFEKLGALIKNLDDMNIRGKQVDLAFGLYDDLDKFIDAAERRSSKMVEFVNKHFANVDKEEAVRRGASKYGHGPAKKIKVSKPRVMKLEKFKKLRAKGQAKVKPHVR